MPPRPESSPAKGLFDRLLQAYEAGAPLTLAPGDVASIRRVLFECEVTSHNAFADLSAAGFLKLQALEDGAEGTDETANWRIEYEIPPLRAIYHAECDDCTTDEASAAFKEQFPNARIRKITKRDLKV